MVGLEYSFQMLRIITLYQTRIEMIHVHRLTDFVIKHFEMRTKNNRFHQITQFSGMQNISIELMGPSRPNSFLWDKVWCLYFIYLCCYNEIIHSQSSCKILKPFQVLCCKMRISNQPNATKNKISNDIECGT